MPQCPDCGISFQRGWNMRRHQERTGHLVPTPPPPQVTADPQPQRRRVAANVPPAAADDSPEIQSADDDSELGGSRSSLQLADDGDRSLASESDKGDEGDEGDQGDEGDEDDEDEGDQGQGDQHNYPQLQSVPSDGDEGDEGEEEDFDPEADNPDSTYYAQDDLASPFFPFRSLEVAKFFAFDCAPPMISRRKLQALLDILNDPNFNIETFRAAKLSAFKLRNLARKLPVMEPRVIPTTQVQTHKVLN